MAVTLGELVGRFPEFAPAAPSLIDGSLADAALMVDSAYYGKKADMAIMYYAAHLIATNPLGEMARLDKGKSEATTYLKQFERIKRSIGTGCRVI